PLSLYLSLPFLLAHPYSHSFPTRRSSDLFVLPLYFTISEEVGGRNDFLGRVHDGKTLKSFGVNPGGYIGFFNPATNKRETFTGNDPKAEERLRLKQTAKEARRAVRYQEGIAAIRTARAATRWVGA